MKRRRLLLSWLAVGLAALTATSTARAADVESADVATVTDTAPPTASIGDDDHPDPLLKLSYQRFAIGNVDGTAVPLDALHLDYYPLSLRWVRAGVEMEGGRGTASLFGDQASVKYAMLGINAGVQLPGRFTPFVEGRLDTGLLWAHTDATIVIPGEITMMGASGATWLYGGGLDAGVDFYVLGRAYLTASFGWYRTTWGSADYEAALVGAVAGETRVSGYSNITSDSFIFKLGFGI